jgi:hypothetical protein
LCAGSFEWSDEGFERAVASSRNFRCRAIFETASFLFYGSQPRLTLRAICRLLTGGTVGVQDQYHLYEKGGRSGEEALRIASLERESRAYLRGKRDTDRGAGTEKITERPGWNS